MICQHLVNKCILIIIGSLMRVLVFASLFFPFWYLPIFAQSGEVAWVGLIRLDYYQCWLPINPEDLLRLLCWLFHLEYPESLGKRRLYVIWPISSHLCKSHTPYFLYIKWDCQLMIVWIQLFKSIFWLSTVSSIFFLVYVHIYFDATLKHCPLCLHLLLWTF